VATREDQTMAEPETAKGRTTTVWLGSFGLAVALGCGRAVAAGAAVWGGVGAFFAGDCY
jgi:hypothetical protein